MSQQEYFGVGSINQLKKILQKEGVKRPFLVTGRKSFTTSGAEKTIMPQLAGLQPTRFAELTPNPKIQEIELGYEQFKAYNSDCLIAVGGGSAIDVAKKIKLLEHQAGRTLPLVAIPTTTGSGSEATYFIVYYVGKEKQSNGKPEVTLPEYVICDPSLTLSLPPQIVAPTGMDALGQAVESYWSIYSTQESQVFSAQAIKLLVSNLENTVNSPNLKNKTKIMRAANLAGKAINITKTTACHSIAYPMTSYFDIPHGHAVGLTLGEILKFNAATTLDDCNDPRGPDYVKNVCNNELPNIFNLQTAEQTSDWLYMLMQRTGLETNLSELGIDGSGRDLIIEKGFTPERAKNNPRKLDRKSLKQILKKIH